MKWGQTMMLLGALDYEGLTTFVGNLIYAAQAVVALWGTYCFVMVWRRISRQRFRNDDEQTQFLAELGQPAARGDFREASKLCEGDSRAVAQLSLIAIQERHIGYAKVKHLVAERFQRDVLSDIEQRLSWVNTAIKSEPMLGLFGTVVGMMGAFGKLAAANHVEPKLLANDISIALITTAIGLAVAIPLILMVASVNIRIRKLEESVGWGMGHVLDMLREAPGGIAVAQALGRERKLTAERTATAPHDPQFKS